MAAKSKPSSRDKKGMYVSKKCPECYTYVPLEDKICHSCKTRLGPIGKTGMAERVKDWKLYLYCILAWLAFIIYIKWAFF